MHEVPRRALLLAAGMGTRLRPLTDLVPKCLVPIKGRPLIEYWMQTLLSGGVEEVLLNTHYLPDMVREFVLASPWASRVTLSQEDLLLGTAGTLAANAAFFEGQSVLVAHADNLTLFDLPAFSRAHASRPAGTDLTMMTFVTDVPSSCGIVTRDGRGVVNGFYEKVADPPGTMANAAVYLLAPEVIRFIRSQNRRVLDLSTDILPHYVGRIWPWENTSYHRDIGTLAAWRAAQSDFPGEAPSAPSPDPWNSLLDRNGAAIRAHIDRLLLDVSV